MKCFEFNNPASKIKVLDYTYSSQPSINTALPLETSKIKTIFFCIGVILSLGFLWLVTKWSDRRKSMFRMKSCSLQRASYYLIEDENAEGGTTLVERIDKYQIRMKRECPSFIYHDRTYIYIEQKQVFVPIRYEQLGLHLDKLKKDKFYPFSQQKRKQLLNYYGQNVMKLKVQSRLDIFIQEMLTPYEVFQTYGIILWIYQQYYIFSIVLSAYCLYTYWENGSEIKSNQEKLAYESYFDFQTKVLINDSQNSNTEDDEDRMQDIQLCNDRLKLDQHKSELMKDNFNGVQTVEHEIQMSSVKKPEKKISKEVKNYENFLINDRNVKFQSISTHKIVPGDIIILNQKDIVPCDCVLLRGEALVNQKYSTGQNYLVRKEEMQNFTYVKENQKSFLLYLGTEIVKIKNSELKRQKSMDGEMDSFQTSSKNQQKLHQIREIVCLVTQTNFSTLRGKFLRAIRYQTRQQQRFFKQTIYFIYIIMVLTTIVYFIYLGVVGQYTSSMHLFRIYLDLLVTAIPPTLPTILNVGIKFVQSRLKSQGINCIIPKSVLTGGKVDTIVLKGEQVFGKQFQIHSAAIGIKGDRGFGLTFTSVQQFETYQSSHIPHNDLQDLRKKRKEREEFYKIGTNFINALTCCHSLVFFRKKLQGSVFQKKVFQFSKSNNVIEDQYQTFKNKLIVLKIIRFREKQRKIGVLVSIKEKKEIQWESMKFATEKMIEPKCLKKITENEKEDNDYDNDNEISMKTPKMSQESINQHYQCQEVETSQYSSSRKVIFIKGDPQKILKNCNQNTYPQNSFDYIVDMAEKGFILYCYAMKQFVVDAKQNFDYQSYINHTDFTFLGFVIMQQAQSEQNAQAIKSLNESQMNIIFMSEKRQLQTTSRAIFNGICNKNQLLLCNISRTRDKVYCKGHIEWQSSSANQFISEFITEFQEFGKNSKISISSSLYEEIFMKREIPAAESIFNKSIIYNKMELKFERNLYAQLQKRKKISCAIGGGGNLSECASLSLELQRSDSAMLSSFYTNSSSLKSIVTCLRICRAGLSTNFQGFNMMILFSLIQFTTVVVLNCNYETMTNDQMLYEDLFITFPIFITLNLTQPSSKLSKELPPNSFFSSRQIVSMVGQLVIQFLAQLGFILYVLSIDYFHALKLTSKDYYIKNGDFNTGSELSLALFVLSNNLYLGIVLSTSVSKPFRKPFYTNPYYTLNLILLWCYNTFLVVFPNLSPSEMRSKQLNQQTEFILVLALVVGNLMMVVMYLFQNLIVFLWSAENPCFKNRELQQEQMVEQIQS